MKNNLVAGILAHVDAGKTTLSESLLFNTGVIKSAGRVDSKNTYLDTDQVERSRGITIYSKNARLPISDLSDLILIDTPGHVDFSTETERALSVLDFAILLISGSSGVQPHTKTLWNLLKIYNIPTLIFVNKMDMPGTDSDKLLSEIKSKLSGSVVAFSDFSNEEYITRAEESVYEDVASCDETVMDKFLSDGSLNNDDINKLFYERKIFPLFFGSALKNQGVDIFIDFLRKINPINEANQNQDEFGAMVYKISHDDQGKRLTYLKVTSGSLKVKSMLGEEKVNELRAYSGIKYTSLSEATKGDVVAIPGLNNTHAGDTFGCAKNRFSSVLAPALSYAVHYPKDMDNTRMLQILTELQDEDPSLNVAYNSETREINVSLMGDIQTEVLKNTLITRYGVDVSFSDGKICYKETIDGSAIGVGHFEPLRHYAEAQIKLEPLERGAGMEYDADLSTDLLDKNWQRLILTHMQERWHRGVLIGAPLTDVKLTLVAGKAHVKHTEGGDFRQATYRSIRQGLMKLREMGACRILEPYYEYTLRIPDNLVGRAMTDIASMNGTSSITDNDYENNLTTLTGKAPVSTMNGYLKEVTAYSKGLGELSLSLAGYELCHNEEEVIASHPYNPESDIRNTPDSVFCMHGAGTVIPWNQVDEYKHVAYDESLGTASLISDKESLNLSKAANEKRKQFEKTTNDDLFVSTEEIDKILTQNSLANASVQRKNWGYRPSKPKPVADVVYKGTVYKEKYMLVDGYNLIFAWDELGSLAKESLNAASGKLNDLLCNYQAITGINLIVVYDAYKLKGHKTEENPYHNITVVYTKEAQTADQYIERYANKHAGKYDITVVTSDGLEQVIIRGQGCKLISSREFIKHMEVTSKEFNELHGVK